MSGLEEQLQHDLTAAMKARDEVATSTLRMVRAAVMNASVAGAEAVVIDVDDDRAPGFVRVVVPRPVLGEMSQRAIPRRVSSRDTAT